MSLPSAVYTIKNAYTENPITLSSATDGTAIKAVEAGPNAVAEESQWTVTEEGNGQYTIKSYAHGTFAYAGTPKLDAQVLGRKASQEVTLKSTGGDNQYTISPVSSSFYWGVKDRSTNVVLRDDSGDELNQWVFTKPKAGPEAPKEGPAAPQEGPAAPQERPAAPQDGPVTRV